MRGRMRWAGGESKEAVHELVLRTGDWDSSQWRSAASFPSKGLDPTAGNHDFSAPGWEATQAAGDKMNI